MQTSAVHDYALLLQILIVVGLLLLAFPADSWTESLLLQSKTIASGVLLAGLSLSIVN